MTQFIEVSAGSEYGVRRVLYEIVEGVMVLRNEGDHDNLSGNSEALDFEGLSRDQAQEKADAINQEPVGHSYDGCHACLFNVKVQSVDAPDWYTYADPEEATAIRVALEGYRNREQEAAYS